MVERGSRQVEHDRRMRALDHYLVVYQAEHGEISEREIEDASRRTRGRAVVVPTPPRARKKRGGPE